jgi:hypothetical protein
MSTLTTRFVTLAMAALLSATLFLGAAGETRATAAVAPASTTTA